VHPKREEGKRRFALLYLLERVVGEKKKGKLSPSIREKNRQKGDLSLKKRGRSQDP